MASIVIGGLSQRLSTRVAAATSALALFFVVCMGVGAWLVASGMMRAQVERQMGELAQARAVHVSGILDTIATGMSERGDRSVGTSENVRIGAIPVNVRYLGMADLGDWNKAAMILGVGAGRLSAENGGTIEMMQAINTGVASPSKALVWSVRLDHLTRRLAGSRGNDGGQLVVRVGGREASAAWGEKLTVSSVVAEAEVMLPNGFGRGQMVVRIGADAADLDLPLGQYALWLSIIGAAATALAVALATITSRRLTRTLSGLADAATAFAFDAGGSVDFHVAGDDEIARLGKAFAGMVERLDQAYRDLDQRSQALLSNAERVAQVGSAIWEPGQSRQVWSEQFHAILGLNPADVSASREVFFDRIHPDDRTRLATAIDAALQAGGRRVVEEFRIIRGDGVERVAQFRAEVARDDEGHPIRVDATIQDITERQRMEDQLDGVVRDLKRSNEELEQFAYVASHDLRQPLRTVRSYLTLIEDSIEDKLDDETREFMDFIRDGVKRMDALITDLLTYSRVGRRVADGPVDTGRMIDLSLLDLQAEVDETQAIVDVPDGLPVVEGDSGELTRLFQNLIGNALKYRNAEQVPHIAIKCRDLGAFWQFSVIDNGIGIPPEHRERAFGIFQRLHGRHEYEGTGIGLAICRKIVERQGGEIWVENTPDGGATFRFTWPKMRRQVTTLGL
ncbi:sensor histidine kinase [Magnetospirillum sulfuroxidans]|uniref:histidine kinase n=1 Tax=Magnetospirillum sulfuroxidans TaxID=611300 RepID=A0ABS5IC11_9PROT|nr:PAS domain-containing sensor histidine kinase [Magnetospirillum sulfuroxidans]MBR9971697.1 PAS domain-containing protein [Magnetospirillum sulfuroxidans]